MAVNPPTRSIDDATPITRPLYMAIIVVLGLVVVGGVVGWFIFAWEDKTVPDGLIAIIAGAAGALGGALSVGKAPK